MVLTGSRKRSICHWNGTLGLGLQATLIKGRGPDMMMSAFPEEGQPWQYSHPTLPNKVNCLNM